MQVGLGGSLVDGQDGVNNVGRELGCQCRVELCRKRGTRDVEEEVSVDILGQLERVQELESGLVIYTMSKKQANNAVP